MTNHARVLVRLLAAGLLLAAGSIACDRNTEAYVEGEQPRQPDLARIFPETEGAGRGLGPPSAPSPMGGAPQRGNVPPAASTPSQRGAPPVVANAGGSGDTIRGTISVAPAHAGSASGGAMLFIIARPFGVNAGPPMAVQRVPSPSFPHAFEIGPNDVMIPSMRFQGDIGITARLDGDGNAMTKLPGDLSGATPSALQPGASGIEIVLDQKL